MAPRMAFLGMGSMGQAISSNLVKNGNLTDPLLLWNRTPDKAISHAAAIGNARAVDTIEDAIAGADIVWSCLATEEAVAEASAVVLSKPRPGKLFIECSTISGEATNKLAKDVIANQGEFVAMPVFGEPSMARRALLVCLPAGKAHSVSKVIPFLTGVIGKGYVDLSDQAPGMASQLKLVGNVLIVQMIESVAEAHVLGEKVGLQSKHVHQVIDSVWSGPYSIYSERMQTGEYYKGEPIVSIPMAQHVANHVLQLADGCGASLPAYKVAVQNINSIEKYDGQNKDISGIYGALRQGSGMNYENAK